MGIFPKMNIGFSHPIKGGKGKGGGRGGVDTTECEIIKKKIQKMKENGYSTIGTCRLLPQGAECMRYDCEQERSVMGN